MVARHLTGFRWNAACTAQICLALAIMATAWMVAQIDSLSVSTPLGIACAGLATMHTARALAQRLGTEHPLIRAMLRVPLLGKLASPRSP
jgi:hypothetical protein